MSTIIRVAALCLVLGSPVAAQAQEKPAAAPAPAPAGPPVSVKVQLVLSRYEGDKKVSSMPYILQLTANEATMTNLRMGTDVPVASGQGPAFNYRPVGTNIDCRAETVGDGTYKLHVTVSDSSVRFPEREKTGPGVAGVEVADTGASAAPAFRSFTAKFVLLIRDGQTAQYTSATDPASGEVLKVDATLNVLK